MEISLWSSWKYSFTLLTPSTKWNGREEEIVDDLAVFSPRTLPDTYKGKLTPIEYHLTALDSILYALDRFGWLLSLRKSTVLKDLFVYLGATWDMTQETIGINNDRLDSILSWREPRSLPEASSRLSSLIYYEDFCLFLKRLAYPLFVMVKRGIFILGRRRVTPGTKYCIWWH